MEQMKRNFFRDVVLFQGNREIDRTLGIFVWINIIHLIISLYINNFCGKC